MLVQRENLLGNEEYTILQPENEGRYRVLSHNLRRIYVYTRIHAHYFMVT